MLGTGIGIAEMPLPEPPGRGDEETDVSVMARWLNNVALCLEDALSPVLARSTSDGTFVSPAARFQALLVLDRCTARFPGYYQVGHRLSFSLSAFPVVT